jgi:hypothetical protein
VAPKVDAPLPPTYNVLKIVAHDYTPAGVAATVRWADTQEARL